MGARAWFRGGVAALESGILFAISYLGIIGPVSCILDCLGVYSG